MTTLVIIDDHPLLRTGLKAALAGEPELAVIGEAGTAEKALPLIERLHPNLVITDVHLPGASGLELGRRIKETLPGVGVLLLTMYKEEDLFNKSLDYHLDGYLLKENAVEEVLTAIRTIGEGSFYISPPLAQFLVNRSRREQQLAKLRPDIAELTAKEREILQLIAQNMTTSGIADRLSVSPKTVEHHRSNICKKLKITGNNALLQFVIEHRQLF